MVHHRVHAYVDPPSDIYKRPRSTTHLCGDIAPAMAEAEAVAKRELAKHEDIMIKAANASQRSER